MRGPAPVILAIVALLLALGLCGRPRDHGVAQTASERLALVGFDERYRSLNAEIASLASGNPAVQRRIAGLLAAYRDLDRSGDAFLGDVRVRLGVPETVAVAVSGTTWSVGAR